VRERAEEVAENLVVVVVMRGVKDTVDGVLVREADTHAEKPGPVRTGAPSYTSQ
jgi:hypothetical protein